ncbi:pimeloyl-ACP methyl ester carboxylesterase [Geothermobacter ehrlichii]|uniref:Pimeloyl-ACP methyl ester carboxylesterase n=1 Tax=Geothermobacter ehrlichii TaxID=213224 RepID=A0A5D3WIH0_9BACT|nr:alpha/beta fold hydrolase [Geothermobacter ehrlichii]TYO97116.1 pimeloyl-ACP methyl ester carboxylesterase [Geothermobacter ehrlichii]
MSQPLRYDEAGKGPAVVLLHGFPLCRRMWQPQMEALAAAGYRVIAPDLPGFGKSPLAGEASMDLYADAVVGLLDHLDLNQAVIGGMSMGGYVLCNLLDRYPQRASAAMFLVTRAAADDDEARARRTALAESARAGDLKPIADAFESILFAPGVGSRRPELVEQVRSWMLSTPPEGVAGGLLAMRDRRDMVIRLRDFDLPALVVGAELDVAVPLGHSQLLAGQLPQARLEVIPQAGHMANLEQPELFSSVLCDFLAGLQLAE